jgi:hypothetical protein
MLMEVRASTFRLFILCIYDEVCKTPSMFKTADFLAALLADEKEIFGLLKTLLESADEKSAARSLCKKDAKSFMEAFQQVRFHSRLVINSAQDWNYRH